MTGPHPDLTIRDGWVVPTVDNQCLPWVLNEVPKIEAVLKYVKNRALCVQAGGNIGIFPYYLSKHFELVETFEPDEVNMRALQMNCAGIDNIFPYKVGLGEKEGRGEMHVLDPTNIGAHRINYNKGSVEIVTIDSNYQPPTDLIWLDIEGAELLALKGAIETIKSYKPVIVLEMAGHSKRFYGIDEDETHAWLRELGYEAVENIQQDVIFVHKG